MLSINAMQDHSHAVRRLFPLAVLVLAVGCSDDLPVQPSTLSTGQEAVTAQDMASTPYINYRDGRINLTVDPVRLVVETEAQNAEAIVGDIVSTAGGQLSRMTGWPGRDHWRLLEIDARGGPGAARTVVETLRQDPRISFADHAYRRALGGEQVLLVNRLAVRFRGNASSAEIHRLVDELGASVEREPGPGDHRPWWLTYPPGVDPLVFAASLHHHPLVEWADPDKYGEGRPASVPMANWYEDQYYLNNMADSVGGIPVNLNVELAWEETKGASIMVAVFDDGVEMEHSEFTQNFSPSSDPWYDPLNPPVGDSFPTCNTIGCAYDPYPYDIHGTSVGGVIAASWGGNVVGVAPEVGIVPVRIYANSYYISDAELADAFYWAVDSAQVDVINFSWIWGSDENVTEAIGYVADSAVVVAAAGNYGESGLRYPASLSASTDVIAVGAIEKDGSPTSYSNDYPDVVAPSSEDAGTCDGDIVTTSLIGAYGCAGSPNNYTDGFGATSAATAMVSGVVALMLDVDPSLSPEAVKDSLRSTADSWGSYTTAQVGQGKVNAFAALNVTPDPVSVDDIEGPVLLTTPDTYEWEVSYSGGDGQYTFLWEVWWDGDDEWVWAGSDPTQQFTLDETDPSFELRVTVSSAGTQDSDSIVVTNWIT